MKWKDILIVTLTFINLITAYAIHFQKGIAEAERKPLSLQDQVQDIEKRLETLEEELKYKGNPKISRIDYLEEELNKLKGQVDLLRARLELFTTKTRILENQVDRLRR
jgi:peptidoglycan hydrolase CwlO-like protein